MRTDRFLTSAAWYLAFLLGQASVLLGLMLALGWTVGFALLFPHRASSWGTGPQHLLPIGPPLVGLALGAAGLLVSRWSPRAEVLRFSLAGLLINFLPLALALLLLSVH